MPDTPRPYVIRQGDTLLRIALMFGVEPEDIRNEQKNEKLREDIDSRMLPVGEILYVPRPRPPQLTVSPQTSNRFQAKIPRQHIAVTFEDARGPLANEAYKLYGLEEDPVEGTLDADGTFEKDVPMNVDHLRIVFERRFVEHEIWVGHLAPLRQDLGVEARLLHLAYLPIEQRVGTPYTFADREALSRTVSTFQKAFGLHETGFADEPTRSKLRDRHGR